MVETAVREAMAQGALLALLFAWNDHQPAGVKADRVTVTLHIDDGVTYSQVSYWAGDHEIGGEGF